MSDQHAEYVLSTPDGGKRVRTPEFYRKRGEVLRQYAKDNRALAMNYYAVAKECDGRSLELLKQADLMDEWAEQAAREQHSDGEADG